MDYRNRFQNTRPTKGHQNTVWHHRRIDLSTFTMQHYRHDCICILTHWGRDKWTPFQQTTFSNAFSLMKTFPFRLKFHWSLFLRFQLPIFQHWFRYSNWLGAVRATSHYLNQWWLYYGRIYASLGLNELNSTTLGMLMNTTGKSLLIKGYEQYAAIYTWSAYFQFTIHYVYGQAIYCVYIYMGIFTVITYQVLNLVNSIWRII